MRCFSSTYVIPRNYFHFLLDTYILFYLSLYQQGSNKALVCSLKVYILDNVITQS